jgi:hypothetical protein
MAWKTEHTWVVGETFPYSTKQVNKAGDRLRKAQTRGEGLPENDLVILDIFRSWHGPTLRAIQARLGEIKDERGDVGAYSIGGRPQKTIGAILSKLVRERTRLWTMQDIAGARIVVPSPGAQTHALSQVVSVFDAERPRVTKDCREQPDQYGYRAIHVVVEMADRFAEIQIRTQPQQSFAQIVEKADEIMGFDLKHGQGPADWLEWLHGLSDELRKADLGQQFVIPMPPGLEVEAPEEGEGA